MNMNRRKALGAVATASVTLPGMIGWSSNAMSPPHAWTYSSAPKRKLNISLEDSDQAVVEFIRSHGARVSLYGGPVFATKHGRRSQWINLISDGADFRKLKRELFSFGVQPISTLELRSTFIKFVYNDKLFNLISGDPDEVCQTNYMISKVNSLPFAHNFLIYDTQSTELYDPYEAIDPDSTEPEIKVVIRPRTLAEGFDMVLASSFESSLLGLKKPSKLNGFQTRILETPCSRSQAKYISERILNYYPDIVDVVGEAFGDAIGSSKLVNDALKISLGLEFDKAQKEFARRRNESELGPDAGKKFMETVHRQMASQSENGVNHRQVFQFMLQNDFAVRRADWMGEGMLV